MADLTQKKSSFTRRYIDAVTRLLDEANDLVSLKSEWSANEYATGAGDGSHNITDEDLTMVAPWLTAEQLNLAVGAVEDVQVRVQANRGYLEALRA